MRPILCMVSDRARFGDGGQAGERLVEAVGAAARAGVQLVQLRERDLEGGPLLRLVARCVEAARGTATRVLVNDRADVALAAGAAGVHLPAHGVPAARIRPHVPRGFLIGRSVHSAAEAVAAAADGALDYLIFGSVFPPSVKPAVQPAGVDALRGVSAAVSIPVLAIGGVTAARMRDVARAGAAGAAAIGFFADAWLAGADRLQTVVSEASLAFDSNSTVP